MLLKEGTEMGKSIDVCIDNSGYKDYIEKFP